MDADQFVERFDKAVVDAQRSKYHKSIEALKKLLAGPVQAIYGVDSFVEAHVCYEIAEAHLNVAEKTADGQKSQLQNAARPPNTSTRLWLS